MPAYTFDNDGTFENTAANNLTLADAIDSYLVYNYTGNAVDLVFTFAANMTATVHRSSGARQVIQGAAPSLKVDADEVLHIAVSGAANETWRIESGATSHGTPASPGQGHTALSMALNPGIYVATV